MRDSGTIGIETIGGVVSSVPGSGSGWVDLVVDGRCDFLDGVKSGFVTFIICDNSCRAGSGQWATIVITGLKRHRWWGKDPRLQGDYELAPAAALGGGIETVHIHSVFYGLVEGGIIRLQELFLA